MSGVPGLGYHIRQTEHNQDIYQEWTLEPSPNLRHQSSTTSTVSTPTSSEYQCPPLVVPYCDYCGYTRERLRDSYSSPTISHTSSSSTDSLPEKCLEVQRVLPRSSLQIFSPLSYFPNEESSLIENSHKKLSRSAGTSNKQEIKPRVTFSDLSEINQVKNNNHRKLSKKPNVSRLYSDHQKNDMYSSSLDTIANTKPSKAVNFNKHNLDAHNNTNQPKDVDDYAYAYR